MSDIATAWAWQQLDRLGPSPAFVTLLFIANEANSEGELKRTRRDLAMRLESDPRTITRHTTRLVDEGLLEIYEGTRSDGGQAENTYSLPLDTFDAKCVQPSSPSIPTTASESEEEQLTALTLVGVEELDGDVPRGLKIGTKEVNPEEWKVAVRALATFNRCNGSKLLLVGTRGGATDALKRIVCRQREHPHLTPEDHEQIVLRNFAVPWWTEKKLHGVGPIYGPKAFPRALACDGKTPRNRGGGRSKADSIDSKVDTLRRGARS